MLPLSIKLCDTNPLSPYERQAPMSFKVTVLADLSPHNMSNNWTTHTQTHTHKLISGLANAS